MAERRHLLRSSAQQEQSRESSRGGLEHTGEGVWVGSISVLGLVEVEGSRVPPQLAVDGAVQVVVLETQTSDLGLHVHLAQLLVLLLELSGLHLCYPTLHGLQQGIVDEHILGLLGGKNTTPMHYYREVLLM